MLHTYLTMFDSTADSAVDECCPFTTTHGTYWWAGCSTSVALAISTWYWIPSSLLEHLEILSQSMDSWLAHFKPWVAQLVELASRQMMKGRAWV